MALIRWEPFREIDSLQREMNRLFESLSPDGERTGIAFAPPAELDETPDAFDLKLEVPGMEPNDLDIEVTAEAVRISGERRSETRSEEGGTTRTEFRYGKFSRVIPLPAKIQNTEVKADYKDGILKVHLPKADEEKHKVFKVSVS
ncbi:Hsp20/alpha crystallin family protein [Oxynema sp. CENA135]|jgi:HSP20 family protein|uniref:Hsp20/alpha crystallin family protein n=1 Tax=Oxynema sp. CENA135 TaxID=984206 RepID=UPI001909A073|nr:Hsp20/alpha crystallin family protein [Oxynema sp. CENA135]MBK4729147.1 Hsp20/alpha crystallin family protein [Oxynema sp. CENA135]